MAHLHYGTETYWGGVLPHSQQPGRYWEVTELGDGRTPPGLYWRAMNRT